MKYACSFLSGRVLGALLLLLLGPLVGRAQQAEWAQIIDTRAVRASQQVTDIDGNTTLAVEFSDSLKVGGRRLLTTGPLDIDLAIIQLNADGQVQWVRQLGGTGRDGLGGFARDQFGYFYVSGSNDAYFQADTFQITPAGAFLAVLQPDGSVLQVRSLWRQKPNRTLFLTAMAVDTSGYCYLTGAATNVDSLGSAAMPTGTRRYSFVAAIDMNAQTDWVLPLRSVGWGGAQSTLLDVRLAPTGGVIVAGYFRGELLIDHPTAPIPFPLLNTASRALVMAVSQSGEPTWAKASTGGGAAGAYALAVGQGGEVYLTGNASADSVRFGPIAVPHQGTFLFRFSPGGTALWGRGAAQGGSHSGTGVVVDTAGNAHVVGTLFNRSVTFGGVRLTDLSPTAGQPQSSQLFVVSYSPGGDVRWGKIQDLRGPSITSGYSIGADARGRLYVMGTGTGRYDDADVRESFLLKIRPTAHITGKIYLDSNANGRQDTSEPSFAHSQIVETLNRPDLAVSNAATGYFDLNTDPGTVTLRLPNVPPHYYLTEGAAGFQSYLPAAGAVDSLRRFGLAPIPNQPDLQVAFSAYSDARPGFITRSRVTLTNVGTTTITSGSVYADLDSRAAYVSSAPAATVTGRQLSWMYPALPPLAQRSYEMQFSLPINVPAGTRLHTSARVPLAADMIPADNEDSLRQSVSSSISPNSIEVSHVLLTLAQVSSGQPIDYTIRFQNTGLDTATTVIVRDTLDPRMIRLNTIQYIGSSANITWGVTSTGVLWVRFPNIRLPPRNVDILRSQGLVRFRMKPVTTLTNGTIIPNRADIYFNTNPPFNTNRVTTIVGSNGVGLNEADGGSLPWTLHPNPANGASVLLTATLPTAGTVLVEICDVLGRSWSRTQLERAPAGSLQHRLEVGALPAGAYVVRLTTPGGNAMSQRLLIP